jgi:hypothetical protein
MLALGIAHGSQWREGRSTEIRFQMRENCPDGAGFLPGQPAASENAGNLVFTGIGKLSKGREPRSQVRVGGLVQLFIGLQAAQDEEQLAQRICLVPVSMIPVAF